jgi:UDP-2-acetamido-3-amino-2,3-dideoxy-glucuronate N-acetyltransferase
VPVKGDGVNVEFSDEMPLDLECQHFADCVANQTQARTDGRNGLRVLTILHDAQRSLDANGEIVTCKLGDKKEVTHATG